MRIEAYNKVNQLYQASQVKPSTSVKKTSKSDQFDISQTAKDYQVAKKAVDKVPEVRMDRVEQLKSQLASGTYDVSMNELADKLLDSYFNTLV